MAKLLPLEVCQQYAPCKELKTECDKLCKKWEELKKRVELMITELIEKVQRATPIDYFPMFGSKSSLLSWQPFSLFNPYFPAPCLP